MKRTTIMMVFALMLAGCNATTSENNRKGDEGKVEQVVGQQVEQKVEKQVEKETISLQLLKADEEAGVTMENSEVYKELSRMISENPDIGIDNDFSIYIVDIVDSGTEDASLLFLGINRLDEPIKNISFNYTLGHENGEFVWKDTEVNLSEADTGIIQSHHAIPFTLGITAEQEALIDLLEQDNQVVKIEGFKFESAK